MGDLISRKALLEELNNFSVRITGLVNAETLTMMKETKRSIERIVEEQATAFDIERVLGQLEPLMNDAKELMDYERAHLHTGNYPREYNAADNDEARYKALCEAIEIIESATNSMNEKRNHEKAESNENLPLTADEMRNMDGKPVWCVDSKLNFSLWMIVVVDEEPDEEYGVLSFRAEEPIGEIWDGDDYGKEWLAYRQEF